MNNFDFLAARLNNFITNLPPFADAAFITSAESRYYLSGFYSHSGCIFVTKGSAYFLVDSRYYEAAAKAINTAKVIKADDLSAALKELKRKCRFGCVIAEAETITVAKKAKLELIFKELDAELVLDGSLDKILTGMRAVKSFTEVRKIKAAQALAEDAFNNMIQKIKPGITEKEIALDLEFHMRKNGASAVAFDLIVLSGANTSLPHGQPSSKAFQKSDLITVDMGAIFEGYHSDMTRTFALTSATTEQKEIYDIVLQAQLKAISAIKAGVDAKSIDSSAREFITSNGYGECFCHSTGHGVGLNIHEAPRLTLKGQEILRPGMVITVEPGIYLAGKFGIRIEDMLIVTNDGSENFTNIPKEFLII